MGIGGASDEALHARTLTKESATGESATSVAEDPATTSAKHSAAGAAPVILELIATDKRTHGPAEGLTQDDFEIVEGRSAAHITSFAHRSEGSLRPLSLWFVLQCPEEHSYFNWVSNGSGFMQGKTATLTPVLKS
jgi:hypothetical protein